MPLGPPDHCASVPGPAHEHTHAPWTTEGKTLSEANVGGPPAFDPLAVRAAVSEPEIHSCVALCRWPSGMTEGGAPGPGATLARRPWWHSLLASERPEGKGRATPLGCPREGGGAG